MLRIGFDAKRAFLNTTGLGNYSRSVITTLSSAYPETELYLYTPKVAHTARTQNLFGQQNIHIRSPHLPFFRSLWRSRLVVPQLKKDQLDIYHGLSHEIPIGIQNTGIRSLVTIHDLIFLRYPQYYKTADRKIYEIKFRYACEHADKIIAVSEQTKRDIIHFLGISADKIEVIYQSCNPAFSLPVSPDHMQAVKARYHLPEQYLLNVGTVEDRKNLMLIARALRYIPDNISLVVIGKHTAYAQKVKDFLQRNGLAHRVHFLENVAYTDLPAIYRQTALFIYPSEFEGFGIPVLEALYSGVPVIAATGSCLEEAGGPESRYVAPDDAEDLADTIKELLHDAAQRSAMREAGLAYASRFTEARQAAALMEQYRLLANQ